MSSLLLENFRELTTDPGAADGLRRLVLDLAVRGKLVPQNPEDEPASELLKRIKAERARRVAAGELRKSKPLPGIEPKELPFDLPEGWVWCRLGEVSFNFDPVRIPLSKKERSHRQGVYPYYGASGVIDHVDEFLFDGDFLLIGEDGANLVSRSTPLAFIASGQFWVNNHAHVLQFESNLLMEYIECFIEATSMEDYISGGFQPKLSQGNMNRILIPLPPEAEQQRIITRVKALLSQTESLRQSATERLRLADALVPSLLNGLAEAPDLSVFWKKMIVPNFGLFTERPDYCDQLRRLILDLAVRGRLVAQDPDDEPASVLLTRIKAERERLVRTGEIRKAKALPEIEEGDSPFELPGGWVWCRLGEVCIIGPRNKAEDDSLASFIPMMAISEVYGVVPIQEDRAWGKVKSGFTHFQEDDIGIAKITPCYENGKAAIFRGLTNGIGAGTTELYILRSVIPVELTPEFIYMQIKNNTFVLNGEKIMSGSAGQKRLPKAYLAEHIIGLPPTAEQSRIVARVETLLDRVGELRKVSERKEELRKGVLRAVVG